MFCLLIFCLLFCCSFVVWQFMLSSCSLSQFGIPNNAGPCNGTTRKLYQCFMPLLIMVTLHIPICGMHELLYVCNTIYLMNLFGSVMFVCRKSILYIVMCLRLLSLLVSILFLHVSAFCLLFVFNFVIITDLPVEIENLWSYHIK